MSTSEVILRKRIYRYIDPVKRAIKYQRDVMWIVDRIQDDYAWWRLPIWYSKAEIVDELINMYNERHIDFIYVDDHVYIAWNNWMNKCSIRR